MQSLFNPHTATKSSEKTIEIYQDPSTLADEVASKISNGEALTLLTSAPICKSSALSDEEGGNSITITIITNLNALYKFFSAYGPDAFVAAIHDNEFSGLLSGRVQLKALRVGSCTGDIHFMITGSAVNVDDVLQFFLQKSQNGPPYQIRTLISRDYELSNYQTVKFQKQSTPYGLIPGHMAVITSTDIDNISSYLIQIAIDEMNVPKSYTENILRFRVPALTGSQDTDCIKLSELPVPIGIDVLADKQKLYKTVQLTRYEVTFLIGKQGKKIEQIRQKSGATVKVIPLNQHDIMTGVLNVHDPLSRQFIRVSGTESQINIAIKYIEAEIYQFRSNGIVSY